MRRGDPLRAWAADLAAQAAAGTSPADVVAAVVDGRAVPAPPEGARRADLVGIAAEAVQTRDARRARGAVYTPPDLAAALVAWATDGWGPPPWRVLDPAAGGGAFLVAAARRQVALGAAPRDVLPGLVGWEVDGPSAEAGRAAVRAWAEDEASLAASEAGRLAAGALTVADGLDARVDELVDLVVGNPPFLGQLASATARDPAARSTGRARFGAAADGYVDTAALFLLAALDAVRVGGRVLLVQPESVLGAAHAAAVREEVLRRADVIGLWVAEGHLFAAGVDTCALVIERRTDDGDPQDPGPHRMTPPVALAAGRDVQPIGQGAPPSVGRPSWAPLLARARGVPEVVLTADVGVVGDLATATAGFRQHHYALLPHLRDDPTAETRLAAAAEAMPSPVITTGLIDPLTCRWGTTSARIGGRRWQCPAVDLDAVAADAPTEAAWFRARLRPKVLVAPQTRVVEAAVDAAGVLLPSTPVVSLEPRAEAGDAVDQAWLLAAALSAPPVTAWALDQSAGTARSRHALKLSARQVLTVPLPVDAAGWQAATDDLRAGRPLVDVGAALTEAYGLAGDHPVVAWWAARLR